MVVRYFINTVEKSTKSISVPSILLSCIFSVTTLQTITFNFTTHLRFNIMAAKLPRRALISVTSAHAKLHGEHPTGIFISEVMHPFNVFTKAGFEVDLTSETGKYYVDWLSEQPSFLAGADIIEWNDLSSAFRQKLDNMPKAEDVDSSKVSWTDMNSK